jgi:putative DNA primase/helicase
MKTAPEPAEALVSAPSNVVPLPVTERHRGHLRMAERFVRQHGTTLRHVHKVGWFKWTGHRWEADDQRADIAAAVQTVKAAIQQLQFLQGDERDELYKDVRKSEQASGIEGMLKLAGALAPISTSHKQLDADPYLFNTPAGTINLRTGSVRPNDRDDLITKVSGAPIAEDPDPEHVALWGAFLEQILPDPEVRAFVQRLFGYAMLGKVTEHVMPIFTGTGANGKGTLRDAIAHAFGDYAIEVDPSLLMESKHERHGSFKMRLRGARLAFCSETEKGRRFAEATMKRLVGGDPIEANLMHRDPISFDPSHTLIMLTNHLPAVSGDDPAVWRRILVVPFDVVIPESQRDGNLPDLLREAGPAVLAWVYEGWIAYQDQGLTPPEVVRARTQEYQLASDVLGRFLEDQVEFGPHFHEKARDLFTAWSSWCLANKEDRAVGSEVEFAKSMAQRGYEKKRTGAGQVYRGLMLKPKDDDDGRDGW